MTPALHRRALGPALGVAVFVTATSAAASNTSKPVAPVSFLSSPCLTSVERATDPVLHLDLGIPFEDVGTTADEAPGTRTMQFFATCRDAAPGEAMPTWISRADATAAAAVDPTVTTPEAADVLEESAAWTVEGHGGAASPCVIPINPADDRMPITCEASVDGIDWDTTGVPAGAYVVWGYTYEGSRSVWRRRPGVVHVVDDAAGPPAAAIESPVGLGEMTEGTGLLVRGCAAGPEDATLTLAWASYADVTADPTGAWVELAELPAGPFEHPFVPPADALYEAVVFRVEARDDTGATFVAHSPPHMTVLPGCEGPSGGTASVADACEVGDANPSPPAQAARACGDPAPSADGGDATEPDDDMPTDDASPGPDEMDPCAGCDDEASGCAIGDHDRGGLAVLVLVLAGAARRRRRSVRT